MTYQEQFRARMGVYGQNKGDIVSNKLDRDFLKLRNSSPNKVDFIFEDESYPGVLSSGNRTAAQGESKLIFYLLAARTIKLTTGNVVIIKDDKTEEPTYWIILHADFHPFYGYYKYKMLQLDHMITYVGSDGITHSTPCYVNGTGMFDIKEYFKYSQHIPVKRPGRALNLVLPTTGTMDGDTRILIGNNAWRYIDEDANSIPGVSYVTVNYDTIDTTNDDFEKELANEHLLGNIQIISNYGVPDEGEDLEIPMECEDLRFYVLKDGKLQKPNLSYSYSTEILTLNPDGSFSNMGVDGPIKVKDRSSSFEQTFNISSLEIDNYLFIVGSHKMAAGSSMDLLINSDLDYEVTSSNDLIAWKKIDNKIILKAKEKIGKTSLIFSFRGEELKVFDIEIASVWG